MNGPSFVGELLGNLAFFGTVAAVTALLLRRQTVRVKRTAKVLPFVDRSNVTVIADWREAR